MKSGFSVDGKLIRGLVVKSVSALLLVAAGCQGTVDPAALNAAFVKVDRTLPPETQSAIRTMAVPTQNDQSFYVGINKSELGQRYFMSAFMKQFYPGATNGAAGYPLGTKVVTFRVQNGKLFVFDASDLNKTSDQFDPTLIIEAYPIVNNYGPFVNTPGSSNYVLFDPAAGVNKYGFVENLFDSNEFYGATTDFQVDLAYSTNFRAISDGAIWDQVFTGSTTNVQLNDGTQTSAFKASGTLGIALRKYKETTGYQALAYPDKPFYWTSEPKVVPNTGGQQVTINANHWAVSPGKPIHWVIDPRVLDVQKQYPQYDIVGALKKGITNWNTVFGFEALTVDIAGPNQSWGDDNTAYVLWDPSPVGIAWATEVSNPNTGEIRNAWIYFSSAWLDDALGLPGIINGTAATNGAAAPATHAKVPALTWSTFTRAPNCVRFAGDSPTALKREALAQAPNAMLTDKDIVEKLLTHVLLHEVGHTLGLRHNFKGSLNDTKSTSVMDYIFDDEAVQQGLDFPSSYDTDAIKYLYGMSTTPPAQPFGTDEDSRVDPYTRPYDPTTSDPLNNYYGPAYRYYANRFVTKATEAPFAVNYFIGNLFDFARAATAPATARKQAFDYGFFGIKVGAVPAAADAGHLNTLTQMALGEIYNKGTGNVAGPAAPDATLTPAGLAELKGNLVNSDKLRAAATRRQTVGILKTQQSDPAYGILLDAQPALDAELQTVTGTAANDLKDLIARVKAAVTPYYN